MKKILLLLLVSIPIYSQKIVENKVDEFTKKSIVRTDWEKISSTSELYLNVRVNKIDSISFLELRFFTNGVASIDKNHDISFMLDNGEIINLHSAQYEISNYGDGAIGIVGSNVLGLGIECLLTETDIEKFKNHTITKVRINTSVGYFQNDVKSKFSEKFKGLFQLVFK